MNRKTAKKINVYLYICLLLTIPSMIYLQIMNDVVTSIILVCFMFVISMVMFWLSTNEHETEKKVKEKSVSRR
jgi:hypothetical protein